MKSYDDLKAEYDDSKAEMEAIQQQSFESKNNGSTNALKEVKRLCKEFGFSAGTLKYSLTLGIEKQ